MGIIDWNLISNSPLKITGDWEEEGERRLQQPPIKVWRSHAHILRRKVLKVGILELNQIVPTEPFFLLEPVPNLL